MATCMAVLLPYPRRKVGLEDTRSRGRRRQEQLVGPIPTPFRRRVADLAPRHRPVLSFHGPLRQGKTPRKRQRLLWIEGSEPAAVPGSRTVPGGPPGSGRIYGLCTDHLRVPALMVQGARETPAHRAPVGRLRPAPPGVARVERDDALAQAQLLAAEAVVVLGVVARVRQRRVEGHESD